MFISEFRIHNELCIIIVFCFAYKIQMYDLVFKPSLLLLIIDDKYKPIYVLFIPYFRLLVFGILVTLVAWFSFWFFPSGPSCLEKCKQRLRNIFVTSLSKVTKNEKWDERNICDWKHKNPKHTYLNILLWFYFNLKKRGLSILKFQGLFKVTLLGIFLVDVEIFCFFALLKLVIVIYILNPINIAK